MFEYNSSEEFQRHKADVFAREQDQKAQQSITEKEKLIKVLDAYIGRHSKTTTVREAAKENNRSADYQLDLSADIVQILEKIKSDLR